MPKIATENGFVRAFKQVLTDSQRKLNDFRSYAVRIGEARKYLILSGDQCTYFFSLERTQEGLRIP